MDQSGIDGYLHRPYAWQNKGERAEAKISGKRFARESFMAAICGGKVLAPICYSGTCNTDLFNMWIKDFLIPELKPGQIVILDNASFHKSIKTKELIEAAGCRLLFLPPYSPELNPIETFWANLKEKVRSIIHQFKSLQEAIDYVFRLNCYQV